MNDISNNKKLYTKIWKTKKIKSHKFWVTWDKFKGLIPRNPKLLDIGCGIRPRIPVKGSYFLDLSKSALKVLESYGGICHCGDAAALPYKSNFFDLVNASEVLEHIQKDEKALREIARVLKPKGYFSFSVPLNMKYWTRFDEKVNHVRRYESKNLKFKIQNAKFRIKYFYINNPSKSKFYKNLATFILTNFPRLGLFLEENISLPIAEKIQKARKREWHTQDFVKKLKDASGVIVICQKV